MRFLHKFTILLSILVIVSSCIQFFVFERFFLNANDSLLLAINEKAANNIGGSISAYFKKTEDSLKTIASDPKIRDNQELLDKINLVIPEVNAIFILDKQGIVSLGSGVEGSVGLNLSQREYFQEAIKGKTHISGVYKSARGLEVVAIATPIIENGTISGVVVGAIWLHESNLASIFGNKSFGRDGSIAITDGQGNIVYHPDQNCIGKKAEIVSRLQGLTGSVITKNDDCREQYVGYSKIPELNWFAIVMTPTAEITQFRTMMLYQIIAVSILTILIVVVISIYTVRRYMKPLDKLVEAFSSIKKGKYRQIDSCGYATEFDEMIQVYNDTIRKLEEVHATLQGAADIDGLTGVYNRRSFEKTLELLKVEVQSGSQENLAIMILDIDHFKQLNDTYGHLAGDDVLKEFTTIAVSVVGTRSVFRFGGDEFAVILRKISRQRVISFAEEIRLQCEQALRGCTISIGIATYPKNADSIDEVLNLADKALYISKETKNKVTEYQVSS
ncbi:MAG: diguanylate cyclase with integral rane sensor [Firmicutes bacterium]|nr:diguanylate cyclase with integral rane sensor [Bacillota bacterium]